MLDLRKLKTSRDIQQIIENKESTFYGIRQIQRVMKEMHTKGYAYKMNGRYYTTENDWNNYIKEECKK